MSAGTMTVPPPIPNNPESTPAPTPMSTMIRVRFKVLSWLAARDAPVGRTGLLARGAISLITGVEGGKGDDGMTVWEIMALVACGSFAAGLLGALTGLGGGIVVVPMLTLFFHVDIRYAVGASIVSVIATSSGAAAAYVREGYTNVRVGILLEVATTIGALIGAALAGVVPTSFLAILFGCVLFFTAYRSLKPVPEHQVLATPDRWAELFRLDSTYPTMQGLQ